MKAFVVFSTFFVLAHCADDFCYKDTLRACSPSTNKLLATIPNCNAKYGAIETMQGSLQRYVNHLIYRSFDFLLMSTYYGNYVKNRPGFEKLYRSYSDSLWQDGIELIKYIDDRGGDMNFNNIADELLENESSDASKKKPNWELSELQSLAKALDLEKSLAGEAFTIHLDADSLKSDRHDPEIAFHIEEVFVEKQKNAIRKLSGYTHDLSVMLDSPDASLAVFLFDEFLQKEKL